MCKILAFSGITDETSELAWQFAEKIGKEMSWHNTNGLGYAAINNQGNLYGERWHENTEAFSIRTPRTPIEETCIIKYKGILDKPTKYNKFGRLDTLHTRSIILHARMATSDKAFYNTHPFVDTQTNTALIHNGVIGNAKEIGMNMSTCDSEAILTLYLHYNVMNNPKAIQDVVNDLDGYYACAIFSKLSNGTPILDVFRDHRASLNAAFIEELNTVVFSTGVEDIVSTCRLLNLKILSKFEVAYGKMLRINAITGEVINTYAFDVNGIINNKKKSKQVTSTTRDYTSQQENHLGYKPYDNDDMVTSDTEMDVVQQRLKNMEEINDKVERHDEWEHNPTNGMWTKTSGQKK